MASIEELPDVFQKHCYLGNCPQAHGNNNILQIYTKLHVSSTQKMLQYKSHYLKLFVLVTHTEPLPRVNHLTPAKIRKGNDQSHYKRYIK